MFLRPKYESAKRSAVFQPGVCDCFHTAIVGDENSTFLSGAREVHLVLRSFRVEIDRTHHVEASDSQRRDERLPDVGVCVDWEPGHYRPRESAQALSAESSPSISSRLS